MRKREKLVPPAWFLDAVETGRAARKWSWRGLAAAAGVSAPSLTRMRSGNASWDTVVRVAKALEIEVPALIDPTSPEGRLSELRRTSPREYEIIARMLGRRDGNASWPPGSR